MSNSEPQPFIITCTSDKKHEVNPFGLVEKLNPKDGEHPKKRINELKVGDVIRLGTNIIQIKEMQKPFTPFAKASVGSLDKVKEGGDENIAFNLNEDEENETGEGESETSEETQETEETPEESETPQIELVDDSE